jgi:hypothetical protein
MDCDNQMATSPCICTDGSQMQVELPQTSWVWFPSAANARQYAVAKAAPALARGWWERPGGLLPLDRSHVTRYWLLHHRGVPNMHQKVGVNPGSHRNREC